MDIAFIENAEDEIDHDERGENQQRHGAERLLESLRGALEAGAQRGRYAKVTHGVLHGVGGLAERGTLREVEADRDGRELALMADRQRLDRHAGPARKGR